MAIKILTPRPISMAYTKDIVPATLNILSTKRFQHQPHTFLSTFLPKCLKIPAKAP